MTNSIYLHSKFNFAKAKSVIQLRGKCFFSQVFMNCNVVCWLQVNNAFFPINVQRERSKSDTEKQSVYNVSLGCIRTLIYAFPTIYWLNQWRLSALLSPSTLFQGNKYIEATLRELYAEFSLADLSKGRAGSRFVLVYMPCTTTTSRGKMILRVVTLKLTTHWKLDWSGTRHCYILDTEFLTRPVQQKCTLGIRVAAQEMHMDAWKC